MSVDYPKYERYKATGIALLPQVPDGWEVKKIKQTTSVKGRIGWHGLKSSDFRDEGAYLVTGTDFKNGQVNWKSCYHVDYEKYDIDPYIQLQEGDLLITKDGTIGKVAVVRNLKGRATLNSGIFVTRPLKENLYTPQFIYWVLNSRVFHSFIDYYADGSTIAHLYQNVFVNFTYPRPPLPEQKAIAAFLDEKTGKIDALLAKLVRQKELLTEKRTALITRAVTRGLNHNAPMKETGIEWLPQVPEHWEVKRLGYLGASLIGLTYSPSELTSKEDGTLVLRSSNIQNDKIDYDDCVYVNKQVSEQLMVKKGDILICSRNGSLKLVGKNALIAENDVGATFGAFMTVFRSEYFQYLNFFFKSDIFKSQSGAFSTTTINQLTNSILKNLVLTLPPIQEQKEIAEYLDKQTAKIDLLQSKTDKQIELLKEYRTSLITSAVTGQIMVTDNQEQRQCA